MTEAEWLTSNDPQQMHGAAQTAFRSQRKRDFFCAACCRLVWPWIVVDDSCRRAVELMETQFDVPVSDEVWEEVMDGVKMSDRHPKEGTPIGQTLAAALVYDAGDTETVIARLVCEIEDWGNEKERAVQIAQIMRDIVGNPFRPIPFVPSWRTSDVMLLAQGIYDERAFDRMPILADALQDAGCNSDDILSHCRDTSLTHVRGCWVVDLVLGKQ